MGGKSLILAGAFLLVAFNAPALAQTKYNYRETPQGSDTKETLIKTTEVRDKVTKKFTSGNDLYTQEADRLRRTKTYRYDTYTTYLQEWDEDVTKQRLATRSVCCRTIYPCPPGPTQVPYTESYTETYVVREPFSATTTRKTGTNTKDKPDPDEISAYRTTRRVSLASVSSAAGNNGSGVTRLSGRDVATSGDSGRGAASARTSSAGAARGLAGATQAAKSGGGIAAPDLAGDWSDGLTITMSQGKYQLDRNGAKYEATYDFKGGKLTGKGVDLTIGNDGNTLSGTLNGAKVDFSKL